MADKQYYVKVSFEWGTDEDGVLTPKNTGGAEWVSMPYDNSVGLQNYAVIPALKDMFTKAGELGLLVADIDFPGKPDLMAAAETAKASKAK